MVHRKACLVALSLWLAAPRAEAFCGFYVGGGGATLFNNATQVVLMREGTLTVLSMQNNYQGPPEDFALVIPVPVVLKKSNVKTLPQKVFDKIDRLDAPRLVEYWEQDPCGTPRYPGTIARPKPKMMAKPSAAGMGGGSRDLGVKVEAQFTVGEYEIVILSAKESTGLDTWLKENGYKIPEGAEPVLKPYVEQGLKFFVAKVNVKKVKFKDDQALLSPLRFHYDSETFSLPVRLGLLNSAGTQDLIVHIFAKDRYEAANYNNVTIPTNLDVDEAVKGKFGPFYASLFDATVEANPGSVVTEYAWTTSFSSEGGNASCDPCPTNPPGQAEILSLGADILPSTVKEAIYPGGFGPPPPPFRDDLDLLRFPRVLMTPGIGGYFYEIPEKVLTRVHVRYTKDSLGEDLVFKKADPITGGREKRADGVLEKGASPAKKNFFQARYAIRHAWTGAVTCKNPKYGRWGLPPRGVKGDTKPSSATDLAFVDRSSVALASLLREEVPGLNLKAKAASQPASAPASEPSSAKAPEPSSAPASAPVPLGVGGGQNEKTPGFVESARGWLFPALGAGGLLLALFFLSRRRTPQ